MSRSGPIYQNSGPVWLSPVDPTWSVLLRTARWHCTNTLWWCTDAVKQKRRNSSGFGISLDRRHRSKSSRQEVRLVRGCPWPVVKWNARLLATVIYKAYNKIILHSQICFASIIPASKIWKKWNKMRFRSASWPPTIIKVTMLIFLSTANLRMLRLKKPQHSVQTYNVVFTFTGWDY